MEVLSWNCRGICNDFTVQALKRLIQRHHPSFVFLCETKVLDLDYLKDLRISLGFPNFEGVLSAGLSGGIALYWKEGLDVRFRSKSLNHIDVEIDSNSPSVTIWRLTGFYGYPRKADKNRSWALIRSLCDESSLPWVILGDFNELLHAKEKEGGRIRGERQMQGFRDASLMVTFMI